MGKTDKKVLLVAFRGELICFMHVLLYALDFQQKGFEVKVILEGAATRLIPELGDPNQPYAELYLKVRDAGLIDCVCKSCAAKMGTLPEAQGQNLVVRGELMGHPGLSDYLAAGFEILTF